MATPHVLIAGAGIGGLTAALALLKRGIDVDVYEQAHELREIGAGLQLSANGNRVLYALGVGEALKRLACEATGKEVRLWNTGQTWKLFDLGAVSVARYGFPYLLVYRPDLLDVLAAAVRREKPGAVHLGARCTGCVQDGARAVLRFEGGEATGDALVGADGVRSRIRQALFGPDTPAFTGIVAWRGTIAMSLLPDSMRRLVGTNWIGPGAHVVHYPVHRGEYMNFVGLIERGDWRVESWTAQGTAAECASDFRGWHEDVHRMIGNVDTPFKWALMGRTPMERWTIGRITLLGDACHPTLPMLAQGAAMAIEDGLMLARALEAYADVETALARYEAARHERTRRVVLGSAENARRFHNPALADPVGAQAYVDREWSEERIRERYEWLFIYDATRAPI
jgi:2-polyprenyl-6-methoxyphenol hydroxylase-like FAD-dependent oxidoreductase